MGVEQAEEGNRDMFSSALEYVLNRKLLKKKVSAATYMPCATQESKGDRSPE